MVGTRQDALTARPQSGGTRGLRQRPGGGSQVCLSLSAALPDGFAGTELEKPDRAYRSAPAPGSLRISSGLLFQRAGPSSTEGISRGRKERATGGGGGS